MEENSQSMLLCDMAQAQSKKETYLEEVTWKKTIFALPGEGDDMDVEPDGVPVFSPPHSQGSPTTGDPQKSFTLLVFSRFCGSGAGKRDAKIIRCFWKSILDRFFKQFVDNLLLRS